ncbi:PepSY domain-containing protein [Cupriavidus sp. AU9028]|uniref:PepSY-associated TM helix domain-containing protein n=1 Tax=Cupriavidus sp. AU9028 TaxID=2871157 RepID=UPI001C98B38D|nr:PepSY-associated TM helix domain-containing protein [Cupriavidus sp. AU9028]MBY4899214.1 PepSY domain-containing protein [Cupriavidus sp. AU9028]
MREGFRQSMAWLHTWAGLLVCWVLFLVFCAGTSSYFKDEISLWMKPELHRRGPVTVSDTQATQQAIGYLQRHAAGAPRWFISLPDERRPVVSVLWTLPPKQAAGGEGGKRRRFETRLLDPATGEVLADARETRGGEFLYRLHFDLHYMPAIWARWIVSFCAMFMLVAIVSGIVTHRRIFKDFFTFRRNKGQRSWLDAHNATAVLALPFHLMITYTGLVTLLFMLMPWGVHSAYQGDHQTFAAELQRRPPRVTASGEAAPLVPLAPLLEEARRHWDGAPVQRLAIEQPGDASATITLTRDKGRSMSADAPSLLFEGATGKRLAAFGEAPGPSDHTRGVMVGLHVAQFAEPALRWLFFLCGLAGCAMVATGALLWAVKTRQKQARAIAAGARPSPGLWLVEALNIGAIAGLPIAFASYFWANRLLPVGMPLRTELEIRAFFIAWAVAALLALMRPSRGMWTVQLGLAATLFCSLPLLNWATGGAHLGVTLSGAGPLAVGGFDLVVLALGAGLGYAGWRLCRQRACAAPGGTRTARSRAGASASPAHAAEPTA